jgi:DNA-binding NtrC family response regulator
MKKILIVDDNEFLRFTLTELLEDSGMDCLAVGDGIAALSEVSKGLYGLVILDLRLPGMNGLELLKKIKEINILIPVIMLSAYGDVKSVVEAIKGGAFDFITKPFDNDAMIRLIKSTLDLKLVKKIVVIPEI